MVAKSEQFELPRARDRRTAVTVVGGGIAGLTAAISLAEAGARVILHEARARLGGRGDNDRGAYRVNLGPHALYRHADFEAWLKAKELLPPTAYPSLTGLKLHRDGRLLRLPTPVLPAMRNAKVAAPKDLAFREWATGKLGAKATEAAIGLASLPTYHADPGELSAAFVQERLARSSAWRPVYYLLGGWSALIERLERRALELGVEVVLRSKLAELPDAPVLVATDLPAAARLLGDPGLDWPGPRNALLDVALAKRRGDPTAVLSLDERIYVSRYSAADASLAPKGESLLQASAGIREGESQTAAVARIEGVLDAGFRNWRERLLWRRQGLVDGGAGPADPPGSDWRDRPGIDRGNGVWLIGDRVAAPGVLSEVSFESARIAARQVLEKVLA